MNNHMAIGSPDPDWWTLKEECYICGFNDYEDNMEQINGVWYCKECEVPE